MILNIELRFATDASAYGLGCVLSHVMPDGSEKAMAFASGTLNHAEKGYPQLQFYLTITSFGDHVRLRQQAPLEEGCLYVCTNCNSLILRRTTGR